MTQKKKLAIPKELAERFKFFTAQRRAVRIILQDTVAAAMDTAGKQEEKITRALDEWWIEASKYHSIDFTAGTFIIEYEDGQLWITSAEGTETKNAHLNS